MNFEKLILWKCFQKQIIIFMSNLNLECFQLSFDIHIVNVDLKSFYRQIIFRKWKNVEKFILWKCFKNNVVHSLNEI